MSGKTVNPYAKALGNKLFAHKVVRPKKGKGSYRRKSKIKTD